MVLYTMMCIGLYSCRSEAHEKQLDKDFTAVGCMEIDHQHISARQWESIHAAASEVCEIFNSAEFRSHIISRNWLASCEKVKGHADSISGAEMYALLISQPLRFSVYVHKLHDAEAETDNDEANADNNRITIDPAIVAGWGSPIDSVRSKLVNVLAHEYVHLLSDRFLDYDNEAPSGCDEDILISYAAGDIVEQIWLQWHRK